MFKEILSLASIYLEFQGKNKTFHNFNHEKRA